MDLFFLVNTPFLFFLSLGFWQTLNPFSEVYGPSFALRCIHAFMDNAMGSFIMGVVTVASFWYFVDGFGKLASSIVKLAY